MKVGNTVSYKGKHYKVYKIATKRIVLYVTGLYVITTIDRVKRV